MFFLSRKILRPLGLGVLLIILAVLASGPLGRMVYPWPYRETIEIYSEQYGLDPYLVAAVVKVESGFNPGAVSARGARGLMQLMPETAEWIAAQKGDTFQTELLFEPKFNISLGCWYLADLLDQYEGETVLALAAYNGGRGSVSGWLKSREWDGTFDSLEDIPFGETRNFVRKVMRTHKIYRFLYS